MPRYSFPTPSSAAGFENVLFTSRNNAASGWSTLLNITGAGTLIAVGAGSANNQVSGQFRVTIDGVEASGLMKSTSVGDVSYPVMAKFKSSLLVEISCSATMAYVNAIYSLE
jgi:hypothetical protein